MKDNGFLKGLFVGMVFMFALSVAVFIYYKKQTETSLDASAEEQLINKLELLQGYIDEKYYSVSGDYEMEDLLEGAYAGYISALGDPYSVYYTAEEYKELTASTQGTFEGIGAYIRLAEDDTYPVITGVTEGSGAEEAGMLEGDMIITIEGEDVAGDSLDSIVSRVRGEAGTTVTLEVLRGEEVIELKIERKTVEIDTVAYEMLEDNVGYVQVASFDGVTVDQFNEAIEDLTNQGMTSLIIDLRNNPGGLLTTAIALVSRVIPTGEVVTYTEDKDGNQSKYYTEDTMLSDGSQDDLDIDVPIVILINGNSASASEVFSGCLRDYNKATIMGENSYGKGIVQSIYKLADGSAIKLTTSYYFSPKGTNIHGTGICPDIETADDPDTTDVDEAIEAAKEYLAS